MAVTQIVNVRATKFIYVGSMTDSINRLYRSVVAARDLDPATSRTSRLLKSGQAKMVKKLAEEAIEVGIDAMNGDTEAMVRESADLIYNLTVLWTATGIRPADVWAEMDRREQLLGIAEKLPKRAAKALVGGAMVKSPPARHGEVAAKLPASAAIGRPIVAISSLRTPKRR